MRLLPVRLRCGWENGIADGKMATIAVWERVLEPRILSEAATVIEDCDPEPHKRDCGVLM